MKLNHLNLTVTDVPATRQFLEKYFGLLDGGGNNNIALGHSAGFNLTTGGFNIDIGNVGVAGDANKIRIGKVGTQNGTFVAGRRLQAHQPAALAPGDVLRLGDHELSVNAAES